MDARFTVDSHADFHFVVADREPRLAHFRYDARRQRNAHRPDVGNGFFGDPFDFLKGRQFVGLCTGDLVDKENARHAAALVFLSFGSRGDIVHTDQRHDLDSFHIGHFGGHVKI